VTYDASLFMDKNKDPLTDDILSLLKKTSDPFVKEVLTSIQKLREEAAEALQTGGATGPQRRTGLSTQASKGLGGGIKAKDLTIATMFQRQLA